MLKEMRGIIFRGHAVIGISPSEDIQLKIL